MFSALVKRSDQARWMDTESIKMYSNPLKCTNWYSKAGRGYKIEKWAPHLISSHVIHSTSRASKCADVEAIPSCTARLSMEKTALQKKDTTFSNTYRLLCDLVLAAASDSWLMQLGMLLSRTEQSPCGVKRKRRGHRE